MEKIKEKPTLGERVKEKAVSAPKELLRKGLDDGFIIKPFILGQL